MRLFFFCIILSLSATALYAQSANQKFTTDPVAFPGEVTQLLNAPNRDDCTQAAKDFTASWSFFSTDQKQLIISMANMMRDRKMLTIPYFLDYFQALNGFIKSKQQSGTFDEWSGVLQQVLNTLNKGNNKPYQLFIAFSNALFTKNALVATEGRTWLSTSRDYNIGFKNGAPYITFDDMTLRGITNGDTLSIKETSGAFFPFDTKWVGRKGVVSWKRAGLDSNNVTTRFNRYSIDCNQSEYTVDTAYLTYQPFIKKELIGRFSDKLLANNKPEASSYPRFVSYTKDFVIDNLADNAKLVGGIQLQGSKVVCSGDKDHKATLVLKSFDGQIGVKASASEFGIKKFEELSSPQAEVIIYEGKDSIYHSGAALKYRFTTKQLNVFRGKDGIARSAFFDSYHQEEITADAISWNLSQPDIYIKQIFGAGSTTASMESANYFEKGKLEKFQNIADYNIITMIKRYTELHKTREIYADELAHYINPKYNVEIIQGILYKLVEDGFIYYDESKDLVKVRQKTINYVLSDQKKIDYDVIKIVSQTDSANAKIDLRSYNMDVQGVNNVMLSDSNYVVIFPRRDSLTVKKNRDMDFNGRMFAGRIDMYGKGFSLDYMNWRMSLANVDTVLINIPNGNFDKTGMPILVPIQSFIEHVTGTLTIDTKYNKSGEIRNWSMPALKSDQNSFVYYQRPSIFKNAYKKDKFYFQLDPFGFDSLNAFQSRRVSFAGKLVSAGIFPDITDRIGIQRDLALGFLIRRSDLPLYGGKGTYTNQISLDNRGLRGSGTINYLPSVTKSTDIIFFPDSLIARAQTFDMPATTYQGVDFPSVKGVKNHIHWKPYADSMIITMDSVPFKLFDKGTDMFGSIVLTPKGLRGSGTVDWADATLKSGAIDFGKNKMNADTSDFVIKSVDPSKFALKTKNVNSHIDFDKQIGDFKSNTDDIATELPYNQYKTSINEFKWDMANKTIHFTSPDNMQSAFTSEKRGQDSLSFTGTSADYNLKDFILKVNEVPFIHVADASIIPDSGKVVIEPEAKMRTLNRAKITADTINEYHKFYNVTAEVYSKHSYKATGDYDFESKNGEKQKISFAEIGTYKDDNKNWRTYGKTNIDTAQKFTLIPKIYYQGSVNIKAISEPVNFKGYAKLQLSNPNIKAEWFTVNNNFTKDSAMIYYTDPDDMSKRPVTTGIVFENDSSDLYTSFFNAKKSSKDRNIFIANGIVYYDKDDKSFVAGNPNKIFNGASRGNVLRYNDASGKVSAEGKMNFGLNFGLVDVQAAGYVNTDIIKNKYDFKMLMGVQFDMKDDLLATMAKAILANNFSQEDLDYFSEDFGKIIPEFIDPKNDKKFGEQMNKEGTFKRPSDSKFTIFFTDLHLVWNRETRSFISKGPIGIAYIGNVAINRVLTGAYLEIGYKKSGDFMNLFIPGDDDKYYFFFYQNNNMQILSGEQTFNVALAAISPDKRRTKTDDKVYQYNPASEQKKKTFLSRMQFADTGEKPEKPEPKTKKK